jgi:hypothetical protein
MGQRDSYPYARTRARMRMLPSFRPIVPFRRSMQMPSISDGGTKLGLRWDNVGLSRRVPLFAAGFALDAPADALQLAQDPASIIG